MSTVRDPISWLVHELIRIGELLGARGLVVADDGNLSARCPDGTILITASGVRKDAMTGADIVRIDAEGRARNDRGPLPTSEVRLHVGIYARRPDVGAIVHAHPPTATGLAAAGVSIPDDFLAEAYTLLGPVPVVPYAKPGTRELEQAVVGCAVRHQAFLLAQHGAVALGRDPEDACRRMERLEHVARALLAARALGGERRLSREEREALGDPIQGG